MKDIKTVEKYKLIPMDKIDDDARKIAVKWVEHFTRAGLNIEQKHKLASDIMNYHKTKVESISDEEINQYLEDEDEIRISAGKGMGIDWFKNKLLNDL